MISPFATRSQAYKYYFARALCVLSTLLLTYENFFLPKMMIIRSCPRLLPTWSIITSNENFNLNYPAGQVMSSGALAVSF
jgi:hypothetical protein